MVRVREPDVLDFWKSLVSSLRNWNFKCLLKFKGYCETYSLSQVVLTASFSNNILLNFACNVSFKCSLRWPEVTKPRKTFHIALCYFHRAILDYFIELKFDEILKFPWQNVYISILRQDRVKLFKSNWFLVLIINCSICLRGIYQLKGKAVHVSSKMLQKEQMPTITEDEAALYDRQIRLWGLDAQRRYLLL